MPLNILNVSYSMAKVRPDSAGGAEQILWQIDRALSRRGHRSLVVAPEGSSVSGRLLATPEPDRLLDRSGRRREHLEHRRAIEEALGRWNVDVIHMHGVDFYEYLPARRDIPLLVTLHLAPSLYPRRVFSSGRENFYCHCVSPSQLKTLPPGAEGLLPVIGNGIAIDDFNLPNKNGGYVAAIGRICPEKGFHHAIEAAKIAGMPMALAGQTFPYRDHLRYFEREIAPRLDAKHRFIGPIGLERKRRILAGAQCLLIPSLCAETSSLVAMEALAAGTPVIAFPAGALPDIIENGRTGFIVRSAREMADAIRRARRLDREECRRAARERFSAEAMIESYISIYRQLSARSRTASRKGAAA